LAPRLLLSKAPSPPAIYTLSLHDALPIFRLAHRGALPLDDPAQDRAVARRRAGEGARHELRRIGQRRREHLRRPDGGAAGDPPLDRKSTRLNSSHVSTSYAVFSLKEKNRD